jgi:hypothetical protein
MCEMRFCKDGSHGPADTAGRASRLVRYGEMVHGDD